MTDRRLRARLATAALAATIVAGSFVVWLAIPAGFIWLSQRTARSLIDALALLLFACPVAMVAFGVVLAKLNRAYLRASGGGPAHTRSAWLKSLSGERALRAPRPVLEVSMTVSAVAALVALFVWFFLFAHSSLPAAP